MLQEEGERKGYVERTRQLWEEGELDESVGEWEKVSEVMVVVKKNIFEI